MFAWMQRHKVLPQMLPFAASPWIYDKSKTRTFKLNLFAEKFQHSITAYTVTVTTLAKYNYTYAR